MKVKFLIEQSTDSFPSRTGLDAIEARLLKDEYIIIMDDGVFKGILTASDIIKSPHRLAGDCLHARPHADADDEIENVLTTMKTCSEGILPVLAGHSFIGVIRRTKIADYLSEYQHELENKVSERTSQLESLLLEKEMLLSEIHHRVKNNLQVVSSLIRLQRDIQDNPELKELLKDTENRVRALGIIHEQLCGRHDLAHIDIASYLEKLTSQLIRVYQLPNRNVDLKLSIDCPSMNIDTAIPCGLLVNELTANALEHAFNGQKNAAIELSLRGFGSQYELIFRDNGIGLPSNISFGNTTSLGMQIINALVQQLKGSIELTVDNGTQYHILFYRIDKEEKRWGKK